MEIIHSLKGEIDTTTVVTTATAATLGGDFLVMYKIIKIFTAWFFLIQSRSTLLNVLHLRQYSAYIILLVVADYRKKAISISTK